MADALVSALLVYAAIGIVFAVAFLVRGVSRIDPAAVGAGLPFRLLIAPGVATFWPLFLWRWVRGAPVPTENNAHRRAAR